nr:MAG TPA: hypothetical protein [Caudoviricetes sp.]
MIIYILCAVLAFLATAMLLLYCLNDRVRYEEIKLLKEKSDLQAVKEFAEKLKAKAVQEAEAEDYVCYIVDRLLKEYEK